MFRTTLVGDLLATYVKVGRHSCSPETLEAMAHSEVDRIRLRVAENPNTPTDVLGLLATDKSIDVRIAVGINPSTPPFISYRLALDEDLNVRLGLADDVNTPVELLEKLSEDSNPYVSHRAKQTIEIVQSQGKVKSLGCRLSQWVAKGLDEPELKYA